MLTVEQGFDDVSGHGLGDEEQPCGGEHHAPARVDRSCERDRKKGRDEPADEWYEPHEPGKDAPQRGIGNADHPEPGRDDDAEAGIEESLDQKEAAKPACGIIEGGRCALQVSRAGQPQEAVTDILALQQDEQEEQHDERAGRKRGQERTYQLGDGLEAFGLGMSYLNRQRLWLARVRLRFRQLALQLAQCISGAIECARGPGPSLQPANLAAQVGLVAGKVLRQIGDLQGHPASDAGKQRKGGDDGKQYRGDAR